MGRYRHSFGQGHNGADTYFDSIAKGAAIFRVTTRADWDGLVSAALLSVVEDVDCFRFV